MCRYLVTQVSRLNSRDDIAKNHKCRQRKKVIIIINVVGNIKTVPECTQNSDEENEHDERKEVQGAHTLSYTFLTGIPRPNLNLCENLVSLVCL